MGRMKHSMNNIISGIAYKLVRISMPFVIRTIIIYKLSAEYAGLDSLFISILQTLSLAELGFSHALTYNMYKPVAEKDYEKLSALVNYHKALYRIIGIIILAIGFSLLPFIKYFIYGSYPGDINVYILYAIYLLNTGIGYFLYPHKQSLLNAYQRSDLINITFFAVHLCIYILQMIALLMWNNFYYYTCLLLLGTISSNIMIHILSKKICRVNKNASLKKDDRAVISANVKSLIGHKLSGIVLNSADSIVISAFLGLTSVTLYSNYYYVISSIAVILTACFDAVTASVGNSIASETKAKNYKDFYILSNISDWVIGFCSVCFLCLYQPFMLLWVGKDLMLPVPAMILFVVYFYFNMIRKMTLTYKDAAGMWWADFWKPYVGTVCNIILNIIMVQIIGINGVVLSSIISMAFISLPWGSWALHKHYFHKGLRQYYKKLFYHTGITVLACIISFALCHSVTYNGIGGLALKLVICIFSSNFVFAIGYIIDHDMSAIVLYAKKFLLILSISKANHET